MPFVRVDLNDPTLVGKMNARFDTLTKISEELFDEVTFDRAELHLNDDNLVRASLAYYLLNEPYKIWRLAHNPPDDERLTEPPKKAALQALTLMATRPMRLVDPLLPPVQDLSKTPNQALALRFAMSVLEEDFTDLSAAMQNRLFNFLNSTRMICLEDFLADQTYGNHKRVYDIDITPDLPAMDILTLFFERSWRANIGKTKRP